MNYGKLIRQIILKNIGGHRFQAICDEFNLSEADRELMARLFDHWQPNFNFDDIVALCQKYSDYPNIAGVMQACEKVSLESALISTLRKLVGE